MAGTDASWHGKEQCVSRTHAETERHL